MRIGRRRPNSEPQVPGEIFPKVDKQKLRFLSIGSTTSCEVGSRQSHSLRHHGRDHRNRRASSLGERPFGSDVEYASIRQSQCAPATWLNLRVLRGLWCRIDERRRIIRAAAD